MLSTAFQFGSTGNTVNVAAGKKNMFSLFLKPFNIMSDGGGGCSLLEIVTGACVV